MLTWLLILAPLGLLGVELIWMGLKKAWTFIDDSDFRHTNWGEKIFGWGEEVKYYGSILLHLLVFTFIHGMVISYQHETGADEVGIHCSIIIAIYILLGTPWILRYLRRMQKAVFKMFEFVHKHPSNIPKTDIEITKPIFK